MIYFVLGFVTTMILFELCDIYKLAKMRKTQELRLNMMGTLSKLFYNRKHDER